MSRSAISSYLQMETPFGQTKFAIGSSLKLPSTSNQNAEKFWLSCSNVTILQADSMQSQIIIISNDKLSFVFFKPNSVLGFEILQEKIGSFQFSSIGDYPVIHNGTAQLQFSSHFSQEAINSSLNFALPLQAFGAVSIFEQDNDFPKFALGCDEPLKVTQFWQNSNFDLRNVLKANFPETKNDTGQMVAIIEGPILFYIRSSQGSPALIHVFGRVGQSGFEA